MATKFNSESSGYAVLVNSTEVKGLTMRVYLEAYYEGNQWYGRVNSISLASGSGWYYGFTTYLDGTVTINGQTALSASSSDGTNGCTVSRNNGTEYWFSRLPSDTGWMAMGSCSSRSVSISCNLKTYCKTSHNTNGSSFSMSGTMYLSGVNHNSIYGGTPGVHTKCSRCGATLSSTHSYTTKTTTAATCTSAGVSTHTCSCGHAYTSSIAALGHKSTNGGTASVHTKCSRCGVTLSSTHSYSSSVQTPADCTTKGTTKYSCACGYSYLLQNIAALGHNYVGEVTTLPTYTSTGEMTYTCSRCGDFYVDIIPKKSGKRDVAYINNGNGMHKYLAYINNGLSWTKYKVSIGCIYAEAYSIRRKKK